MISQHNKAKIPTRTRMSIIHGFPQYPPRMVLSLGIVQIVCGISIVFLCLVLYRFDRDKILSWSISLHFLDTYFTELLRVTWIGFWVLFSGLVTLLVSCKPYSSCQNYMFFVSSLITVTVTGIFVILISNNVIQHSVLWSLLAKEPYSTQPVIISTDNEEILINHSPDEELSNRSNSILVFNVFMLCFCSVSFVISIVSFSIVSHHLCTCTIFAGKLPNEYHFYDGNTLSRKERIVQWVMQQSQLNDLHLPTATRPGIILSDVHDFQPSRKKLMAIHSNATNSTKLSIYETS